MNNNLVKLIARCNEMDITEQINWLGDATMLHEAKKELAALEAYKKSYGAMVSKFIDFCQRHGLGKFGDNYSTVAMEYAEQLASVNEMQARKIVALERSYPVDGWDLCAAHGAYETARGCVACENERLREALRRYMIFENNLDGYLELSREFGACEHPESSVWMTEWLERVLREPAKAALTIAKEKTMK